MVCVLHYDFEVNEEFTNQDLADCVLKRNGKNLRVSSERIAAFMRFICAKDPNYEKVGKYMFRGKIQSVYVKKGDKNEI